MGAQGLESGPHGRVVSRACVWCGEYVGHTFVPAKEPEPREMCDRCRAIRKQVRREVKRLLENAGKGE